MDQRILQIIQNHPELKSEFEEIYPELKENEDDRIRNRIICYLKQDIVEYPEREERINKMIAYLEKQKEQKPTPDWMPKFLDELRSKKNYFDWDEHRDIEGGILAIINWIAPTYFNEKEKEQKPSAHEDIAAAYQMGLAKGRNEQKPTEWSEEDEAKITFLERLIRYNVPEGQYGWVDGHKGGFVTKLEAIAILKSLLPQPRWKPSEEQLSQLQFALNVLEEKCGSVPNILWNLCDELKKL